MASKLFAAIARQGSRTSFTWAIPGLIISGWIFIPCIDEGWRVEHGITKDPEWQWKLVEAAKKSRLEAYQKANGIAPAGESTTTKKEEEIEEEAGEEEAEEEEPAPVGDDTEEAGEEEEEKEEEEEQDVKPWKATDFYPLTKGKTLTLEEKWDNLTLKSLVLDDENDEFEDEDDEDEGNFCFAYFDAKIWNLLSIWTCYLFHCIRKISYFCFGFFFICIDTNIVLFHAVDE
jgi:hypothetical protein